MGKWNKRYVWVDHGTLKCAHDEKGNKGMKIIDLNDYSIEWKNKAKDKYIFSLSLIKGKKSKYKNFVFASKEEDTAKGWFHLIDKI